jgi:preprotein translocase subunit SecD
MNLKAFFLLSFCIILNKSFAQRRDELIFASDTAKIKIESALYVLYLLSTETDGIKALNSDKYYCIEKDNKMTLNNIDSLNIGYDKYHKLFNLNFYFNKKGKQQLTIFSTKNIGKDVGFFINNKLISAGSILCSIEGGSMTLNGNFSESELIILKKEIEAVMHK